MVNMFNMGKFNNVRLAHNTYIPTHGNIRQPQPRLGLFGFCGGNISHCHNHCGPQNITINQGPQGFWGFMTGLCQGLLGGFFGGGMFGGFGMGNMYGMGMPGMYGGSLFNNLSCLNLGNTVSMNGLEGKTIDEILGKKADTTKPDDTTKPEPETDKQKQLNELKTKYAGHTVEENENGTYTVKNNNGETVKTGKYEDLMKPENNNDEVQQGQVQQNQGQVQQNQGQVQENQGKAQENQGKAQENQGKAQENQGKAQENQGQVQQGQGQQKQGQQTKPIAVGANKVKAGTHNGTFTVHDDVNGSRGDIKHSSANFGTINNQGYPTTITVGQYSFKFLEVRNGTAFYQAAHNKNEEYRLEQNVDGTFGLNQYKGDRGAGNVRSTQGTQNKGAVGNTAGKTPVTQNKNLAGKPVAIEFYADVQCETPLSKNRSDGGYAKAKVNGKEYIVYVGAQDSHTTVMKKLGEEMIKELKKDGYKNIKITNNSFSFQISEKGEVRNVQHGNKTDWNNAANKQKPMKLNIIFSIKVNAGNVGTASVKLPNGQEISAWVGPSLTSQRARVSLADDIQEKLQEAGWTNVTLVNDTFNWESGPKKA